MSNRDIIPFILVGMLNTIFGYSIFALMIYAKFHYSIAVMLSTVLGVLFNFKTMGKIVFKNTDNSLIFKFIAAYVVIYIFNIFGIKIYSLFDDNMYLAGMLMIIPAAALSYILQKTFVFKRMFKG